MTKLALVLAIVVQRYARERAKEVRRRRRGLHAIVAAEPRGAGDRARAGDAHKGRAGRARDVVVLALEVQRVRLAHLAEVDRVHAVRRCRHDLPNKGERASTGPSMHTGRIECVIAICNSRATGGWGRSGCPATSDAVGRFKSTTGRRRDKCGSAGDRVAYAFASQQRDASDRPHGQVARVRAPSLWNTASQAPPFPDERQRAASAATAPRRPRGQPTPSREPVRSCWAQRRNAPSNSASAQGAPPKFASGEDAPHPGE